MVVRDDVVTEVFHQFFKDSDVLVRQIAAEEAFLLPSRNAREIKRLLNLFRFCSFIAAGGDCRTLALDQAAKDDEQWRDALLVAGLVCPNPKTNEVLEPEWLSRFRVFLNRKPSLRPFVGGISLG